MITKKSMLKFVAVIFVLLFTVFLFSCGEDNSNEDSSLNDIKEAGKLILGCDSEFPPMGFEDENGNITGFDVELAKLVADRIGVSLEPKAINWDTKELELSSGKIDCIWNGYTINQERDGKVEFTKPYLNNKQVLVVVSNSSIKKIADLKDKIVGAQITSAGEDAVKKNKALFPIIKSLKTYENYEQAVIDLSSSSRVDAVAIDLIYIEYFMKKKPDTFRILDETLSDEYYGIGLRKGSVSLRKAIDDALDSLMEDGTIEKLSKKWFSKNIVIRDVEKLVFK